MKKQYTTPETKVYPVEHTAIMAGSFSVGEGGDPANGRAKENDEPLDIDIFTYPLLINSITDKE